MGFRKTAQARIFVDESIPSFLKAQPVERLSVVQPSVQPQSISSNALSSTVAPSAPSGNYKPAADRRRQPFVIHPVFLGKAIAIALLLNASLYGVFQSPLLNSELSSLQPASSSASVSDASLKQKSVISYHYSSQGLVESP